MVEAATLGTSAWGIQVVAISVQTVPLAWVMAETL